MSSKGMTDIEADRAEQARRDREQQRIPPPRDYAPLGSQGGFVSDELARGGQLPYIRNIKRGGR